MTRTQEMERVVKELHILATTPLYTPPNDGALDIFGEPETPETREDRNSQIAWRAAWLERLDLMTDTEWDAAGYYLDDADHPRHSVL